VTDEAAFTELETVTLEPDTLALEDRDEKLVAAAAGLLAVARRTGRAAAAAKLSRIFFFGDFMVGIPHRIEFTHSASPKA